MKKRFNKQGELNISFGWLFAIIVGATILVLVIFGVARIINLSQHSQQTTGAKELGVLFNPLETGFESASSVLLKVNVETRIYNECAESGEFGKQKLSLSEYSFRRWPKPGIPASFENKYIFSKKITEGKSFYVFSKPFEFPFKIADLTILTSSKDKYCFDSAPEEIENEIRELGQANFAPNCTEPKYQTYTKICFDDGKNCNIEVDENSESVKKNKEIVYFATVEDNFGQKDYGLMYAAIFSDKKIYECQLKRLSKRAGELSEMYKEKAFLVSQRGCDSGLETDLSALSRDLENMQQSSELSNIQELVENIKQQNENSQCRLW